MVGRLPQNFGCSCKARGDNRLRQLEAEKGVLGRHSSVADRCDDLAEIFSGDISRAVKIRNPRSHVFIHQQVAIVVQNIEILQKTADGIGANIWEDALNL